MPASEFADVPTVAVDSRAELRIDCYVRSTVCGPVTERITAVVDRLQTLRDRDRIADYRVIQWPPECQAATEPEGKTRRELVAEFERWAAQRGYSLEPAFSRREIQSSVLGLTGEESREQVRVPVVALVLSADDPETDTSAERLRGVVPYTDQSPAGDSRTYSVDEWLSAVELDENGTTARSPRRDQPTRLESQR